MSSYSEGQTHQLVDALEAAGFTPADITRLGQFHDLPTIRSLVRGQIEVVTTKHTIDFDTTPFTPKGWEVREEDQLPNHVRGQVDWDATKVSLHLSDGQKDVRTIKGHKLREELKDQPVFGAQMLDHLLANPQLIPEEWKGKYVSFWGTIYRISDGDLYVRCLCWDGGQWDWSYYWLNDVWGGQDPAAVSQV